MRIAHIVQPGASEYEKKCQRVDSRNFDVAALPEADVAHVYGAGAVNLTMPYVSSFDVPRKRFQLRKPVPPRFVLSALPVTDADGRVRHVPEAVAEEWFEEGRQSRLPGQAGLPVVHVVGSFARPSLREVIDLTLVRIHRFRDDVSWRLFDAPPSPLDLQLVDAWVDPATSDEDFDGFVAEALVSGKPVVASRTPINAHRMEKGRTGFLVPRKDPNELTHAILGALFKPEVAKIKIDAARQTAGKFRPRQRFRVLERIYEATVT